MNCLWCDEAIIPSITWKTIVPLTEPMYLCPACTKELTVLQGGRCRKCSRMSRKDLCVDCERWQSNWSNGRDPLEWNISVFQYNDWMQEVISRWKYRGDYCLGKAFLPEYQRVFRQHFSFLPSNTAIVPIPLSEERLRERGFNQAELLADCLPRQTDQVLKRIHGEKQSKKTRLERLTGKNPFKVTQTVNNPVVLADDIYTTGTTLRHAASVLKQNGCPKIYALTLVRG
ncbi:ComF family protein [Lentibacillus lipolyticus]|nr:ComF family protein [Lentibacillus lipolyticus]